MEAWEADRPLELGLTHDRVGRAVKIFWFWLTHWQGRRYVVALLSGILMGLTPSPSNAWFLAWVALVPLWLLAWNPEYELPFSRTRFISTQFFTGLAWGIGYHGFALSWITGIHPMTWLGVNWWVSLMIAFFAWSFITLWGAVLVGLWAVAIAGLERVSSPGTKPQLLQGMPIWLRVLVGTALWCGLERLWEFGPLLWTSLAYTQSPYNLAILHLGQLSGPLTVTAAIVAVNGMFAAAWLQFRELNRRKMQQILAINVSLLIGLHLLGLALYSLPLNDLPNTALRVGIIQGNIPNQIKLSPEGWRRAIEGYTTGYRTLADQGVEAILTPETALPYLFDVQDRSRSSFYEAILEKQVPAWVGAIGKQGQSITNSLFTVMGTGKIFSRYDKVKLVPLGEYIPFEQVLGKLIDRLSPLEAHMAAGKPGQRFDTPFGRAIVSICYDSAFTEHFQTQAAQGGQFILSAANNAHYSARMPAQHHAQDVMRAIETDRWAVRAANTGYSGIVDPHGKTRWISVLNTYAIHTGTVYRRQTKTLYVRWGNWLTPSLVGLAVVSVLSRKF
mgnify:CR=1 FL=1